MKNNNLTAVKKILAALAITTIAYSGAIAQAKGKCVKDEQKVCRPTADGKGVSCYATKNAQNYKVCKGKSGYYVCCHTPVEVTAYTINTIDHSYDVYNAAYPDDNSVVASTATTAFAEENTVAATANCGRNEKHVCKKGPDGNTTCYKTDHAQNYKVCKGADGYHVCCNPPR